MICRYLSAICFGFLLGAAVVTPSILLWGKVSSLEISTLQNLKAVQGWANGINDKLEDKPKGK